jgi:hypothetical protein
MYRLYGANDACAAVHTEIEVRTRALALSAAVQVGRVNGPCGSWYEKRTSGHGSGDRIS